MGKAPTPVSTPFSRNFLLCCSRLLSLHAPFPDPVHVFPTCHQDTLVGSIFEYKDNQLVRVPGIEKKLGEFIEEDVPTVRRLVKPSVCLLFACPCSCDSCS